MLVTWAERTPPKLAKEWRQEPWANLVVKLMEFGGVWVVGLTNSWRILSKSEDDKDI